LTGELEMSTSLRLSQIGVLVAVVLLPFKIGGCGHTACLTVTAKDLAMNNGACPSVGDAQTRFAGDGMTSPFGVTQSCELGGGVAVVDGPGELDGELCCYPVDLADNSGEEACGTGSEGVSEVSAAVGVSGNGGSMEISAGGGCFNGNGGDGPVGSGGFGGSGGSGGFGGIGGAGGFGGGGGAGGAKGTGGATGVAGSGGHGGA
jgi:hypothetical protein